MADTFRSLCEELIGTWEVRCELGFSTFRDKIADIDRRARAALAQPEPQGPTDEELADTYWKAWHEHLDRTNSVLHAVGLRAVLARWGRPAIEPVPGAEVE
jgi:hypothetical protein